MKAIDVKKIPRKQLILDQEDLKRLYKARKKDSVFYAFRASKKSGASILHPKTHPILKCVLGARLVVKGANRNHQKSCAAGVNVGTLSYVLNAYIRVPNIISVPINTNKVWLVKFKKADLACMPRQHNWNDSIEYKSKFRLVRGQVVGRIYAKDFGLC